MVHQPSSLVGGQPVDTSPVEQPSHTATQWIRTPSPAPAQNDGLQSLRKTFLQRGFSEKATEIIVQSWSTGTLKRYRPYITKWFEFSSEQQTDPYNPPLNLVFDFLVQMHEKGLEYTTINTARSALSAIILPQDNINIGNHPVVSIFMRGIFKNKPPRPRYQTTWDVDKVLTYLSSLDTASNLTLKLLIQKLIMLVALVSAQRGQSLHMMDLDFMKENDSVF